MATPIGLANSRWSAKGRDPDRVAAPGTEVVRCKTGQSGGGPGRADAGATVGNARSYGEQTRANGNAEPERRVGPMEAAGDTHDLGSHDRTNGRSGRRAGSASRSAVLVTGRLRQLCGGGACSRSRDARAVPGYQRRRRGERGGRQEHACTSKSVADLTGHDFSFRFWNSHQRSTPSRTAVSIRLTPVDRRLHGGEQLP